MLVLGFKCEKQYGSLFFLFLNLWLCVVSQMLVAGFEYAMVIGVGEIGYFTSCKVGYSNVLFGLLMV